MNENENFVESVPQNDPVNHPSHYCVGGVECFPMMRKLYGDFKAGAFAQLNAFKYQWRTGHKNGRQDLEKAEWYLSKYNKELAAAEDEVKNAIRTLMKHTLEYGELNALSDNGKESKHMEVCQDYRKVLDLLGIHSEWNPESGTLLPQEV